MPQYRIVCTEQEQTFLPTTHPHHVAFGTGPHLLSPGRRWTLEQILAAMDDGDHFYTMSPSSGRAAGLQKYRCEICSHIFIRTGPDASKDNNLDALPRCHWR